MAWGPRVAIAFAPTVVLTIAIVGVTRLGRGTSASPLLFCLFFALVVAVIFATLVIMNLGFRPRVRGRYLEAGTVLGRQSLDLAAIRRAGWQTGRSGTHMLLLVDSVSSLTLPLPLDPAVTAALRQALREAGQRGRVLPWRVTNHFGLPRMPGAPRAGHFYLPVFFGVMAVSGVAGLLFAFAWR